MSFAGGIFSGQQQTEAPVVQGRGPCSAHVKDHAWGSKHTGQHTVQLWDNPVCQH